MVQDDLGGFGDGRLRALGAQLLGAMQDRPTMCMPALAEDRSAGRVVHPSRRQVATQRVSDRRRK